MENDIMASVHSTVFKESETLEGKCIKIEGYDFNQGVDYSRLLKSFISTGFQASNLGEAIEVVNQMVGAIFVVELRFSCQSLIPCFPIFI